MTNAGSRSSFGDTRPARDAPKPDCSLPAIGWQPTHRSSAPACDAARASGAAIARSPDETPHPPLGRCTEWVASNTTGQPVSRITASERMSATRVL